MTYRRRRHGLKMSILFFGLFLVGVAITLGILNGELSFLTKIIPMETLQSPLVLDTLSGIGTAFVMLGGLMTYASRNTKQILAIREYDD